MRIYEVEVAVLQAPGGADEEPLPLLRIVTYATAEDHDEAIRVARDLLVEWTGAPMSVRREVEVTRGAWVCYVGGGDKKAVVVVDAASREDVAQQIAAQYGGHPWLGGQIAKGFWKVSCEIDRNRKGVWA